ncbi:GntR family transcriptional regulator [Corynebacterium canis]|uniref:GntR family transcriptional regulator n=1 Tax=Corynebacterium canis TaxID=679663 RepID=A0A5C5UBP1_9CORY|nr:GntR family transcriptional regulator [Corynebacterium canis]TWT23045.1 GntR family transcriptional regulator [Corynebacterium canis]WJY74793.1 Mannosyl-D-glycerate transport/metabolism system repressor MngR [Corynebacterium canis]
MGKATVDQLARLLTNQIHLGELRPGEQLAEIALSTQLGVSRNTLREAFRVLARDGLVEHIPHRGVFVRTITEDIPDVYAFRRFVELGALDHVYRDHRVTTRCFYAMEKACDAAEAAASTSDWANVGAANSDFHQAIVDLVGSQRLSELSRVVLTQARLLFLSTSDWKSAHKPFIDTNRRILAALQRDDVEQARILLSDYLLRSERLFSGQGV